ncbi:MAG: excinuclease ABC subunit UvrA [Treponema sp.]|jgi:excinuclease ABC subunit A|nr:excinuclease ABC subunit UvrA [Treponema sp.]
MNRLIIKGAREHNLKNIDVELPRNAFIVISGISGSGKSSLAFDTIFAEGQRRYIESLSSYARQFLGRLDKPDVDHISGLSPAIAIEQKTTHRNPRSTVGTVTEIYDYYRLLFARIGVPHCPRCGKMIREQPVDLIIDSIMSLEPDTKIQILAPLVKKEKGEHEKIIRTIKKLGFARVRIDGMLVSLDDPINLDKQKKHSIDAIVDRLIVGPTIRSRLAESVETALNIGQGIILVLTPEQEILFSQKNACPECGVSIPLLEPRLFSFNNPAGACSSCAGLGAKMEFDPALIIPDWNRSFNEGGIVPYNPDSAWYRSRFESLAQHYCFSLDTPLGKLPETVQQILLHGTQEKIDIHYENREKTGSFDYKARYMGVIHDLNRRYRETESDGVKSWLEKFMTNKPCELCRGRRLKPELLAVTVGEKNIFELSSLSVTDSLSFFNDLTLKENEQHIAEQIIKEIHARLQFMANVGLEYLSLERRAATLSGGEAQRIRLATQIGSSLMGVLYILDEPSIGLHQRDNQKLIDTLLQLRDIGNTVIVVEHDEQTLRTADYVVDLGPGAGVHGGAIIAHGSPDAIMTVRESLTGQFLAGTLRMEKPASRRQGNGNALTVSGITEHNLKNITVTVPLGVFCCITGVSGSGKSTLVSDVLFPAVANKLYHTNRAEGAYTAVEGIENLDKIIAIDQSPIGRTPRSNPATYVGVFTNIRELFAQLPEAKARGYKAGRFSFNVKGGRCEHCSGDGTIKIEMNFLPDVYSTCDICKGKRFNSETLQIRYRGKNIAEVLDMTVDEACDFFIAIPNIAKKLNTLHTVGLGYVKLGQSAVTLSGGEAQRVKLALELSKQATGKTLYLLDEPTTGLHFADIKQLMTIIHQLTDQGNTIIMIEHNLDVLAQADYIIDLGPEGGDRGGTVIVSGTPEQIALHERSYTGTFLKHTLEKMPCIV